MKRYRLQDDVRGADVRLAQALMEAIGSPDFAGRLLDAVRPALPASHCTIFALRSDGRVEAISAASGIGEVAALTAVEYIRLGFDRKDTNMRWLGPRKAAPVRQFWLSHQFAEDVADEAYRRLCYGVTGIRERLSLLAVLPDGHRTAVSFYRTHAFADFTRADFDWAGRQVAVVVTALSRHVRLTGVGRLPQALRADRMAGLPARERQLMTCIVSGMTTREAADQMGVELTTALTYRYRAFHRLGIRTHRQLIALIGRDG